MQSPFCEFLEYINRLVEGYIKKESILIDDVLLIAPNGTGKSYVVDNMANILEKSIIQISYCKSNIIDQNREMLINGGTIENMINVSEIKKEFFYIVVIDSEAIFNESRVHVLEDMLNSLNSYRERCNSNIVMVAVLSDIKIVPYRLQNRVKIFNYGGLDQFEKSAIVFHYIKEKKWPEILDEKLIFFIIAHYTKEAGVYQLLKIIKELYINVNEKKIRKLDTQKIIESIGEPYYRFDVNQAEKNRNCIGIAWTKDGGILLPIEIQLFSGKGKWILTGNIGKTMAESIAVVNSYYKNNRDIVKKENGYWNDIDVHINIPEIALTKDGASAAMCVFVIIYLILSQRKMKEITAFSGEISLLGKAVRVGGLKEKISIGVTNGISTFVLPIDSKSEFMKLPEKLRGFIDAHFVNDVCEIIDYINNHSETIGT